MTTALISFDDFEKVDIRIGTIIEVEPFPQARKPAFKLKIDFGDKIGVKKIFSPDHQTLHARNTPRPPGRRRGQLPTPPNRPLHVRSG